MTPVVKTIGVASREVEPDRVSVVVVVKTAVKTAQREALQRALELRKEISGPARARFPEAKVVDARVQVAEHRVERETERGRRTETEWIVGGYYGICSISIEEAAERGAEVFASFGAGDEYAARAPAFFLSEALRAQVVAELECDAVKLGRAQAGRLAEAADCTLGAVLTIGEDEPSEVAFERHERSRGLTFASLENYEETLELIGEIRPEPVTVRASVPVRFALVPR